MLDCRLWSPDAKKGARPSPPVRKKVVIGTHRMLVMGCLFALVADALAHGNFHFRRMRSEWNKRYANDVGESYEELLEKTKVRNLDLLARTADEDALLRDKGRYVWEKDYQPGTATRWCGGQKKKVSGSVVRAV